MRYSRTVEDAGPYKPSPAEKGDGLRWLRRAPFTRFSVVDRGLRAVEGAFPVAVPEKIYGLALSLIFSTVAMFAKGKLTVLGVAEDKPHP